MKSQHSKTVFRIVLGWVEHILENFEVQSYFEKKSDFLDFFGLFPIFSKNDIFHVKNEFCTNFHLKLQKSIFIIF